MNSLFSGQAHRSFPFAICLPLLLGALLCDGCSLRMQHAKLSPPARSAAGTVNVARYAKGVQEPVGYGRMTAFALPVKKVNLVGHGNELLMLQLCDALASAGYTVNYLGSAKPRPVPDDKVMIYMVTPAETGEASTNNTVLCEVTNFNYDNYTWLFPVVPTWGAISCNVSLVTPDRQVLWQRSFDGNGHSFNFFNGYTAAAEKSMTKMLNQMVKEFASEDFSRAVNRVGPAQGPVQR